MIRRSLETIGRAADTELTAFTDGALARSIFRKPVAETADRGLVPHCHAVAAREAGSERIIDRHAGSGAGKGAIPEVERLHWRIWNGKAKTHGAHSSASARSCMSSGERSHGRWLCFVHKLWHALREVDNYLRGQRTRLVNYAKRYRATSVGTSVTEGTANFLSIDGEQGTTDAVVATWRRLAAAGSVRGLQRRARVRPAICLSQHQTVQLITTGRLIPHS